MQPEDTERIELETIRLVEEPETPTEDPFIGTVLDGSYL
jgi:hypothetical protein